MFDQWGAESHWDVMERLALCDRGEGTERKREEDKERKSELNESF